MLWPWRAIVLILATTSSVVCGAPTVRTTSNDTRNVAQTNVECIAPDGQDTPAALKSQSEKNILTLDNNTVSCSLREGDTTFIISMKTRRFGANSELRCRTRNFPPTATNGRRWTAQLHSNANVSSVSQCSGSKRNMFDSHFMLSTRT